jgi:hypothetical protein
MMPSRGLRAYCDQPGQQSRGAEDTDEHQEQREGDEGQSERLAQPMRQSEFARGRPADL